MDEAEFKLRLEHFLRYLWRDNVTFAIDVEYWEDPKHDIKTTKVRIRVAKFLIGAADQHIHKCGLISRRNDFQEMLDYLTVVRSPGEFERLFGIAQMGEYPQVPAGG